MGIKNTKNSRKKKIIKQVEFFYDSIHFSKKNSKNLRIPNKTQINVLMKDLMLKHFESITEAEQQQG